MQNIIKDIKNNSYRSIYLLYGEETYLKKVYKDRLKEAIVGRDDSMNYNYFEGKNISVKTVIDIAETLPFFAEHRLIVLENSGFFKNANEDMAAYIKDIPETSVFVFVEDEIDRRGKIYKYVKEHGYICEMARQNTEKLIPWILKILKKEGKKITEANMKLFLTKTGDDMENILRELEKLVSYTYGKEVITTQDIEEICSAQITGKIFDMIAAVSEKNQKISASSAAKTNQRGFGPEVGTWVTRLVRHATVHGGSTRDIIPYHETDCRIIRYPASWNRLGFDFPTDIRLLTSKHYISIATTIVLRAVWIRITTFRRILRASNLDTGFGILGVTIGLWRSIDPLRAN